MFLQIVLQRILAGEGDGGAFRRRLDVLVVHEPFAHESDVQGGTLHLPDLAFEERLKLNTNLRDSFLHVSKAIRTFDPPRDNSHSISRGPNRPEGARV